MRDEFIFDGRTSKDFNLVPCYINNNNDTYTISKVEFQTFKPTKQGFSYFIDGSDSSTLTTTLSVCQVENCEYIDFTIEDIERIQRWLCRSDGFYPFSFIRDDGELIVYNAKIDMETVEYANKVIALNLNIETNAPYGYTPKVIKKSLQANENFYISDYSSKTGLSYCDLTLKCLSNGNYQINFGFENLSSTTTITNCSNNEIITISNEHIITSSRNRDMSNEFNYIYPKIYNSLNTNRNKITVNLPCELTISYRQIRKVGL